MNKLFSAKWDYQKEEAYISLFRDNYAALYSYAFRILHTKESAEDVVQDVFYELYNNIQLIDNCTNIRSYLYKVVYNKSINILKHDNLIFKHNDKILASFYQNDVIQNPTEEEDIYEERIEYISKTINELPPKCKEVMKLKIDGLSNQNIAEKLNISLKTVETHITTAYKKIKHDIGQCLIFMFFSAR